MEDVDEDPQCRTFARCSLHLNDEMFNVSAGFFLPQCLSCGRLCYRVPYDDHTTVTDCGDDQCNVRGEDSYLEDEPHWQQGWHCQSLPMTNNTHCDSNGKHTSKNYCCLLTLLKKHLQTHLSKQFTGYFA